MRATQGHHSDPALAPLAQFLQLIQQMCANSNIPSNQSPLDPVAKMAKALDDLRASPAVFEKGADNRRSFIHSTQFLAVPVCSLRQLWLLAGEVIRLGLFIALSGYDLGTLGQDGCVTTMGWQLIHDPAKSGLKLKFFSSANVGSSSQTQKGLPWQMVKAPLMLVTTSARS